MIGSDNLSKGKTELAFDLNYQEQEHLVKLEFQSKSIESFNLDAHLTKQSLKFSSGLFYEKHLKYIKLSEDFVPFSKKDLGYLLQSNYDEAFKKEVYQTPIVTYEELRRGLVKTKDAVRIQYNNRNQYKSTAKMLGLMDDFKVRINL